MSSSTRSRALRSSNPKSIAKEEEQEPTQPQPSNHHHHQRVFSDSDETKLLKTYLKVVSSSSSSSSSSNSSSGIVVTSPSMEAIEASLKLRFSHTQIIDKLRRLRLKYHRQARTKSLIKTPHDHRLFSLSRQIWGRRSTTAKSSSSATDSGFEALREELGRVLPRNWVWESGLECLGRERVGAMNEDWIVLRLEEAELATRKAELVNECVQLVHQALALATESNQQ